MAFETQWGHSTGVPGVLAGITVPNANLPTFLKSGGLVAGSHSWVGWLKPLDLEGHTAFRNVLGHDGADGTAGGSMIFIRSSQVGARLYLDDGTNIQAAFAIPGDFTPWGEWTLFGYAVDVPNKTLYFWARNATTGSVLEATNTWSAPRTPAGAGGDLIWIRKGAAGRPYEGVLGLNVFRGGEVLDSDDIEALWSTSPSIFDLVNRNAGNMGGNGVPMVMTGHCICGNPGDSANYGARPGDLLSVAGDEGCLVYIQTGTTHDDEVPYTNLNGATTGADATWNIKVDSMTAFITGSDGLTGRTLDPPGQSTDGVRGGDAPGADRLARGAPSQTDFMFFWSNSRGSRTTGDEGDTRASNHAMGYLGEVEANVRGVFGIPVWADAPKRWFGFDQQSTPATTGTVVGTYGSDLERMGFSGGLAPGSNATGPGVLTRMAPSSVFHKRCQEETASRMTKDRVWRMRLHVLAFPGSTNQLLWRTTEDATLTSGTPTDLTSNSTLDSLDTEVTTHTWTASDAYSDPTMTLNGVDKTNDINVGDLVVGKSGTSAGSAAQVTAIEFTGGNTVITLSHALTDSPVTSDVLTFGPWSIKTIDTTIPASSVATRGFRLEAIAGGLGVHLAAIDCWATNVNGFVIGSAGWGGAGYTPQLDGYFPGALAAWMEVLEPSAIFLHNASQSTSPSAMLTFAAECKTGKPDIDFVLCSDMDHKSTTTATWQDYMLNTQTTYPASGVMEDSTLGNRQELWEQGLYYDLAHPNLEGMQRLAAAHIAQFSEMHTGGGGGRVGFARVSGRRNRLRRN